ncbi:MAG: hypothetical protein M3R44_02010 [Candidatus Eremiobacteraeota bacterium]|nr:hypothetical protein [Candidatus Eremiobacteraeota bacterium]
MRPSRAAPWVLFGLGCAALGPDVLHAALAAAAGTLFEAAPFLLAAELAPRRVRALLPLAGCGCRGPVPGAVSVAATALCWLTFGPAIALARLAAGLALFTFFDHAPGSAQAQGDAVEELLMLAPSAALAVTVSGALSAAAPGLMAAPLGATVALLGGLAIGASAPCATAAVAIAAALAPHLAPAAAGVLMTGGLVRLRWPLLRADHLRVATHVHGEHQSAGFRSALRVALAGALGMLVRGGAAGFVSPRLLPLAAVGAVFALVAAGRVVVRARRAQRPESECGDPKRRAAALVPAIMLAALLSGSPVPAGVAQATQLADAYPGERLSFAGPVHRSGVTSVIERYQITCCRADASPVVVRLTSELPVADGTWIAASGILQRSEHGLELRAKHWQRATAPADPFIYR